MYRIFRWILLILFPFACIKLGYIYAQHDKFYVTSDRIRKENIRFFDRIDPSTIVSTYGAGRILWIFLLLSPLPDEGEKKQSRLLTGGKRIDLTLCTAWFRVLQPYRSPCLRMAVLSWGIKVAACDPPASA